MGSETSARLDPDLGASTREPGVRTGRPPGTDEEARLTIGYVSPGWPVESFANGVVTSLVHVTSEMRRLGHRALTLPQAMVGSSSDDGDICPIVWEAAERSPLRRIYRRLLDLVPAEDRYSKQFCRCLASTTRRLVAQRGLQLLEMEEAFGWPSWVRKAVPIPIIVRLHGPWFLNGPLQDEYDGGPAYQRRVQAEGEGIRSADGLTAPSLDVLERTRAYYNMPLEDAVVIPNPAPRVPVEARWRREEADPDLILFVGRFDRHKGGDLIIDAFAEVGRRNPRAKLRFAGVDKGFVDDDGRRRQIEEYIREKMPDASASGRVEWVGRQPPEEVAKFRRQAGVTVCCSRYETFGYTTIEAMAFGSPLVAAGSGAILELIDDGTNGLICQTGEAEDLAEKICQLQLDGDLAARLGQRAALDCESKYDPGRQAEEMAEFYRRTIESYSSGRRR